MNDKKIRNLRLHLPNIIDITYYTLIKYSENNMNLKQCIKSGKVKAIEESYNSLTQEYSKLKKNEYKFEDLSIDIKTKLKSYLLNNKKDIIDWIISQEKIIPSTIYDIYLETLNGQLTESEELLFKAGSQKTKNEPKLLNKKN